MCALVPSAPYSSEIMGKCQRFCSLVARIKSCQVFLSIKVLCSAIIRYLVRHASCCAHGPPSGHGLEWDSLFGHLHSHLAAYVCTVYTAWLK